MISSLLSVSTARLQMQFRDDSLQKPTNLAIGTGFFWRTSREILLITNLHNVTGKHPDTGAFLSDHNGIPNYIVGSFSYVSATNQIISYNFELPLHDGGGKPTWLEHKTKKVDITAIVFSVVEESGKIVCANDIVADMLLEVAQDVFVLGYPKNISVQNFPIWKRASVASEPALNAYQDQPTIFIDTATKDGMSGSPVFAVSRGTFYRTETNPSISKMGGGENFIGIYSGRLGVDPLEAQLGIVWKKVLIEEILKDF